MGVPEVVDMNNDICMAPVVCLMRYLPTSSRWQDGRKVGNNLLIIYKFMKRFPGWLSQWNRVTHICISNITITGSDNGLSSARRQAIIYANAGLLSIGTLGTNFSEILYISIQENPFENVVWKMASLLCRPQCVNQATGLDAWASRVKCPARFVSHLHEICIYIYMWVVYSLCFFCCLFITVTWWYVWCFEWASRNQEEVQACLVTLWLSYRATVYTKPL